MKFALLLLITFSAHSFAGGAYPRTPDPRVTPGALCDTPISYRYPERIAYCDRDALNGYAKEAVFIAYRKLGYSLSGQRKQYKVDHFIPLCAGGSNDESNLWPQYYTISAVTDSLEQLGCEVLALGKITQRELVELIKKAKLDNKQTSQISNYLGRLKQRR